MVSVWTKVNNGATHTMITFHRMNPRVQAEAGTLVRPHTISTGAGANTVMNKPVAKLTEAGAFAPLKTNEQLCKTILASPHDVNPYPARSKQDYILWASVFGMEQDFVRRTLILLILLQMSGSLCPTLSSLRRAWAGLA